MDPVDVINDKTALISAETLFAINWNSDHHAFVCHIASLP